MPWSMSTNTSYFWGVVHELHQSWGMYWHIKKCKGIGPKIIFLGSSSNVSSYWRLAVEYTNYYILKTIFPSLEQEAWISVEIKKKCNKRSFLVLSSEFFSDQTTKYISMEVSLSLCVICTILVSFSRDNALFASKAKINVVWNFFSLRWPLRPRSVQKYFKQHWF